MKGQAKDAEEPRLQIVKSLLAAGARADYMTSDTKMTAAHWAAYNKDFSVVRELFNHGASHFAFSHMGRLPIDVGGSSRAWDVVDVCLKSYFDKVCPDNDGRNFNSIDHPVGMESHNFPRVHS